MTMARRRVIGMAALMAVGLAVLVAMGGMQSDRAGGGAAAAPAEASPDSAAPLTFGTYDVVVETGSRPLAAYQVEITVAAGDAKLVGIEGGEHPEFTEPPFYDPAALREERVVLAAFSTAAAESAAPRRDPSRPGFTMRSAVPRRRGSRRG